MQIAIQIHLDEIVKSDIHAQFFLHQPSLVVADRHGSGVVHAEFDNLGRHAGTDQPAEVLLPRGELRIILFQERREAVVLEINGRFQFFPERCLRGKQAYLPVLVKAFDQAA